MSDITIRPFELSEWKMFRDFRLAALKEAPGAFSTSYDAAATRTPAMWQAQIQSSAHQVFGLFDQKRLIGITAVFTDQEDPSGQTASLAMSYLLPSYRGRGLSNLFYDARLSWIRSRPQLRKILVSHRLSNDVSRRANQRHGFIEIEKISRTWPDGETEDEIFYALEIPRA